MAIEDWIKILAILENYPTREGVPYMTAHLNVVFLDTDPAIVSAKDLGELRDLGCIPAFDRFAASCGVVT